MIMDDVGWICSNVQRFCHADSCMGYLCGDYHTKNGVEFHQKPIGAIRWSLARFYMTRTFLLVLWNWQYTIIFREPARISRTNEKGVLFVLTNPIAVDGTNTVKTRRGNENIAKTTASRQLEKWNKAPMVKGHNVLERGKTSLDKGEVFPTQSLFWAPAHNYFQVI